MSRYAALAKRVARAEQAASRSRRTFPRLAFLIHGDDAPEATVQGFRTADGVMVSRKPGEALSDTLATAWQHPDVGLSLFAVYPAQQSPDTMPGQTALSCEAEPMADPFAMAGVGREDARYRGYWRPEAECADPIGELPI